MKFGLVEKDWELISDLLVKPLKNKGAKIWVFGSRARGDFQPFSDLDILYDLSGKKLSLHEVAMIQDELENSTLPIKVDFVNILELAKSYQESVFKDRKEI